MTSSVEGAYAPGMAYARVRRIAELRARKLSSATRQRSLESSVRNFKWTFPTPPFPLLEAY